MKRTHWLMVLIMLILGAGSAYGADQVVAGTAYYDPTFTNIGIRWQVSEDDNLNAQCTMRYREAGAVTWHEAMALLRTHPGLYGEGGDRSDNRFAGSIFFLDPGTAYEIELTLIDPDGGSQMQTITATTARPLDVASQPTDIYVEPGSGSGSGTAADPFQGLQQALDTAQAGAVIHLAPGTYEAGVLTISGQADAPIVIMGPVDPHTDSDETHWAVIDGQNTDRGVLTIGSYDRQTSHIIISQVVVQNGYWGVDAQNTSRIAFRNNLVRNVGFGFYNRRDNGWEGRQELSDNTFVGRTSWPGDGIPSERGIDLRGSGNVVCFNRVRNFGDGVSLQPFTDSYGYANDIYGNDISEIVDDPIEIDYNSCNTRVWRNRVVNGRMGVSLAPIYGGPVYIFRNQFFNLESSAYKMNREPAGLVIIHNSSAKLGNGTSSPDGWQNTLLRNNIIIGTRYVFEEYGLVPGSQDDWDYDALGTDATPFAKWDNVRYTDVNHLQLSSGIEAHSVGFGLSDWTVAALPAEYGDGVEVSAIDLRLKSGAAAIDAGQVLPNINTPFVSDGHPDCGAFEYGSSLPHYGPRSGDIVEYEDPGDQPDDDTEDPSDQNDSEDDDASDNASGGDGGNSSGGGCFIDTLFH